MILLFVVVVVAVFFMEMDSNVEQPSFSRTTWRSGHQVTLDPSQDQKDANSSGRSESPAARSRPGRVTVLGMLLTEVQLLENNKIKKLG